MSAPVRNEDEDEVEDEDEDEDEDEVAEVRRMLFADSWREGRLRGNLNFEFLNLNFLNLNLINQNSKDKSY